MKIHLSPLTMNQKSSIEFDFDFEIADLSFLKNHDVVGIKHFHAEGKIEKVEKKLFIDMAYKGAVTFVCERCLKEFDQYIESSLTKQLLQKDSEELDDYLLVEGEEVDIVPLIQDDILINLPIQVVCKEDCIGLCPTCGVDLNVESCRCHENDLDPRFESLRNFFTNNEEV